MTVSGMESVGRKWSVSVCCWEEMLDDRNIIFIFKAPKNLYLLVRREGVSARGVQAVHIVPESLQYRILVHDGDFSLVRGQVDIQEVLWKAQVKNERRFMLHLVSSPHLRIRMSTLTIGGL